MRPRSSVFPVLALWLLGSMLPAAAWARRINGPDEVRSDVTDTFLRMRILAAVLDSESAEARPFPGPTPGLVPATVLRDEIEPSHRKYLGSARDAWGHPLLYWSDGRSFMLLSVGSDGEPEFDYSAEIPFASIPRRFTGVDPTSDLIVVDGIAWRGPASQTDLLARAMADLRSLGTAVESYAIDNNVYPGPVAPIAPVETIETDLSPVYIRAMPKIDPWTDAYLYWSDATGYAIVSLGSDGIPDDDYAAWGREEFQAFHPGATAVPGRDIVFVDGAFVQWPLIPGGP